MHKYRVDIQIMSSDTYELDWFSIAYFYSLKEAKQWASCLTLTNYRIFSLETMDIASE